MQVFFVRGGKLIGRETVQYVANIVKYYVAYQTSMVSQLQRGRERERVGIDTDGR